MERRSCGVLERIYYSISCDCRLVSRTALSAVSTALDEFLGVVPSTSGVIHVRGEEYSDDSADHEETRDRFGAEDETYEDRGDDSNESREDHFLQRCARGNVHAGGVVGFLRSVHKTGFRFELMPYFFDDHARSATNGADSERCEEEDNHRAEEGAEKDFHFRKVDDGDVCFVKEGGEKQEGGECCGADRVAFGECLRRIAAGVELVCHEAHVLWSLAHFHNASGVIRDRSKHIHGEHVADDSKHAHRSDGGAVETTLFYSP